MAIVELTKISISIYRKQKRLLSNWQNYKSLFTANRSGYCRIDKITKVWASFCFRLCLKGWKSTKKITFFFSFSILFFSLFIYLSIYSEGVCFVVVFWLLLLLLLLCCFVVVLFCFVLLLMFYFFVLFFNPQTPSTAISLDKIRHVMILLLYQRRCGRGLGTPRTDHPSRRGRHWRGQDPCSIHKKLAA